MARGSSHESNSMLPSIQSILLTDSPEFVVPLCGKYICSYGNHGLQPPVTQTGCGHRICDTCVKEMRTVNRAPLCPGNEDGCLLLSSENVYPDRGIDREMLKMAVFCPNTPNCKVTPIWKLLNKHIIEDCKFNLVPCPNSPYGCKATFPRDETENHLAIACKYHMLGCRYCDKEFPGIHITEHEDECKHEEAVCGFVDVGCSFHGCRKDVCEHRHCVEVLVKHLDMTNSQLNVEQIRNDDLHKQFQALKSDNDVICDTVNGIDQELHIHKESHTKLKQQIETVSNQSETKNTEKDFASNRQTLQNIHSRLSVLETSADYAGNSQNKLLEEEIKTIRNNEHAVALHDVTLAEHEIRFRCLETSSHNGILLWKITNFRSRKKTAKNGTTSSIYSQPFYTDSYGYKMCARIYLDGDGMGKSTHASLYFVVMKGEYDALLPWPFRQRVTMYLLDQENGRKHIRDAFKPDPTSTSFHRPGTTMNVASGSPLFVAQSVLESPIYLRNDSIYIMIKIDIDDLNHFGL